MCGVFGLVANEPVNQLLYDGLQMLQHRGQDAAGIATLNGLTFHMHKGKGMVREVFRTRNMRELSGNTGIGHVRYPTAGNAGSTAEAQPFYVSSPFGIMLAHNGNLTNTDELYRSVCDKHLRHVNTGSDSEVLLNVLAHELHRETALSDGHTLTPDHIFNAVSRLHTLVRGAYGVVALIAGYGLLAFRDPYGIRPLILGRNRRAGGFGHFDDFAAGGAAHDGVVNQQDVFAFEFAVHRVEFLAHGFFAGGLAGHDEGAADVAVFDEAFAVGFAQVGGEFHRAGAAGVGDGHDDVDVGQIDFAFDFFGQGDAHVDARLIDGYAVDDGIGTGEIDVFEQAGASLGCAAHWRLCSLPSVVMKTASPGAMSRTVS